MISMKVLCIFLIFIDFNQSIHIQFNLHSTEWTDEQMRNNLTVIQHDCLRVDIWEQDQIYEINSYCLAEWPIVLNNNHEQNFTFEQLAQLNVTSQQLYRWSASMDLIENYQYYLDKLALGQSSTLSTLVYYNCSQSYFGPHCEYSFALYNPEYSSLNEIIYQYYRIDQRIVDNQTCYIHFNCNLGSINLCIGWINICDGIVQCIDGTDEENCWQLELNECNDDEFRCDNGQCIPSVFVDDNIYAPDCADGSDELNHIMYEPEWKPHGSLFKYEEIACIRYINAMFVTTFGSSTQCLDSYFTHLFKRQNILVLSETADKNCSLAMKCYFEFAREPSQSFCNQFCPNNTCRQLIMNYCPSMFLTPQAPVLFGHIYFAYTRTYAFENYRKNFIPEFICYNEQLCSGFLSNVTPIQFHNLTCRRPHEFPLTLPKENIPIITGIHAYISRVFTTLYQCNTIHRNQSQICNKPLTYQCQNSSKCISQIRLLNDLNDCDYYDDELKIDDEYNCPIHSSQMYVNCTGMMTNKTCLSRKAAKKDCTCDNVLDAPALCNEEFEYFEPEIKNIKFTMMCDRFVHYKPSFIDNQIQTDETECEYWPCDNVYTHCDGIWHCQNGADELNCFPSALISCRIDSFVCVSKKTTYFICLPQKKINDGVIDCIGASDEPQLCTTFTEPRPSLGSRYVFYCNLSSRSEGLCRQREMICDQVSDCFSNEDEQFCHYFKGNSNKNMGHLCTSKHNIQSSYSLEYLCQNLFQEQISSELIYFSLNRKNRFNRSITKIETNTYQLHSKSGPCYRSPYVQLWLNKQLNYTRIVCLCPPNVYGNKCQYQNERVSLTLYFRTYSDSWHTSFIIFVFLIDDSYERIIHSYEKIIYLPVLSCKTKYNIDLLYSTRPRNTSKIYSIHIDIYEQKTSVYRGSLLLSLPFPFLPVHRIARQLNIPHTSHLSDNCSIGNNPCGQHGQCRQYFNINSTTFCQCDSGWSGQFCTIRYECQCSSNRSCLGQLATNQSICLCPQDRWGRRCLLRDYICQSNQTCRNGGECIPIERFVPKKKNFLCICPKGFFGDQCQYEENQLSLTFDRQIVDLPEWMLVHFIEVQENAHPQNGSTMKRLSNDGSNVTIYWQRRYDIAFIEFIPRIYYLITVNNQSKQIEKTIQLSDRCLHVNEILNESFSRLHLIRRVKYYHWICQQNSFRFLLCFYDEIHVCLCQNFSRQRQANCFLFDHGIKRNCLGQSNCQNNASCLQDNDICPQTSVCICEPCSYGHLCQFKSDRFALSLDNILGNHIQPFVDLHSQPMIVQISLILTIIITVIGFINSICSLITFMNKEPRKNGCGYCLLTSSVVTLLLTIIFCMKFTILLHAQMTYITNQAFLLFQCYSLDFLLKSSLYIDQWLNACVAIERAWIAYQGVHFQKQKSQKIAKITIPILICFLLGSNFHEITYRSLLSDTTNDQQRIWCIFSYPSTIEKYHFAMNIIHFSIPFLLNFLSAIVIIIKTMHLRATIKAQQKYREILMEQLSQHKHLLIAPLIIIILSTPRLVIIFVSSCMKTSQDAWIYLIGYFISFIPPILTFFIFVLPSEAYKNEFFNTIQRYKQFVRVHFLTSRLRT